MRRYETVDIPGRGKLPVVYKAVPHTKALELKKEFTPGPQPNESSAYVNTEQIFAAYRKTEAALFLVEWKEDWGELTEFQNAPCLAISNQEHWCKMDQGGKIYTLPAHTFVPEQKVWPGHAVISYEPVKPITRYTEEYSSGRLARMKYGIRVHFVDDKTIKKIKQLQHKKTLISRLLRKWQIHHLLKKWPSENED